MQFYSRLRQRGYITSFMGDEIECFDTILLTVPALPAASKVASMATGKFFERGDLLPAEMECVD